MPHVRILKGEPGYIDREEWEYTEWAARVSRDIEDIRESTTEDRWREHVRTKYPGIGRIEMSESQLSGLWDRGMVTLWQRMPEAGITPFMSYPRGIPHLGFYGAAEKHFISFAAVAEKLAWFVR